MVYNNLDIEYSIQTPESTSMDLDCSVRVLDRFDLSSHVEWEPTSFNLKSTIEVPYSFNLLTKVLVPDNKTLNVDYTVVLPPTKEITMFPLQDTYTSSSKPLSFYGQRPNLITGNYGGGEYRIYIRFDISSYLSAKNDILKTAELILSANNTSQGKLKVYECLSEWNENFLAWRDNVVLGELISETAISSKTKVNLSDYIQRLKEIGNNSLNLCITSEDYVSFYSKENGYDKPALLISYFLANWEGKTDISDLLCRVEIPEYVNLPSSVIPRYSEDLLSSVYAVDPDNPIINWSYSLLSTVKWNPTKCDLVSSVTVTETKDGETSIYGTVHTTVKDSVISQGISLIRLQQIELSSTVSINSGASLYVSVTVMRTEEKDIGISTTIERFYDLRSSVLVNDRIDLSSTLCIMRTEEENLGISTRIEKEYDIIGSVNIQRNHDLYSTFIVSKTDGVNQGVSCWIEKEYNNKWTIYIPESNNLYSTMVISRNDVIEQDFSVSRYLTEDLESFVKLSYKNDLYCTVIIQKSGMEDIGIRCNRYFEVDLNTTVIPRLSVDMYNKLSITRNLYIYSTLRVVQENVAELNSIIHVATPFICQLYSHVTPRCKRYTFLKVSVNIKQKAREYNGSIRRILPREWKQEDFLEERYVPLPPTIPRVKRI